MDEDEIEVLSSIFEEDPETFKMTTPTQGVLQVPITLPEKYSSSFLKHLPHIKISFKPPTDKVYPDETPLDLDIKCTWLDETDLKALRAKLTDEIWQNAAMLYDCFSFIQDEDFFDEFPVDISALENRPEIITFNELQLRKDFNLGEYTCGVCFTNFLGDACLYNTACTEHVYCRACAKQYMAGKIEDRAVSIQDPFPPCMEPGCEKNIVGNTMVMHDLVGNELIEKYGDILLDCLMRTEDVHYCPRQSCNAPTILYDRADEKQLQCCGCPFIYCTRCSGAAHHGFCKMGRQDLRNILAAYETNDTKTVKAYEKKFGLTEFKRLLDEAKTDALLHKTTRPCPNCNARTHKFTGCNKMDCAHCHCKWCWLCGTNLRGYEDAYHHFNPTRTPNSACANKLFDGLTGGLDFEDNFNGEDFAADLARLGNFM